MEGEFLGEVAKRRWPVLIFAFSFDVCCFIFRFTAKLSSSGGGEDGACAVAAAAAVRRSCLLLTHASRLCCWPLPGLHAACARWCASV